MLTDIDKSWHDALASEFEKDYFADLRTKVQRAYISTTVFPPPDKIFNAFTLCPFDNVKVVILGQDPYHNEGQAMGLAFSVDRDCAVPPSLKNIFKELEADLGLEPQPHGDLSLWAQQGVLLLNSVLTVKAHEAHSHRGWGWEKFTDAAIETISTQKENVVFILWGTYAKKKARLINEQKHLILKASHPSPLSASRGFFGCKHFSKTNEYLAEHDMETIRW